MHWIRPAVVALCLLSGIAIGQGSQRRTPQFLDETHAERGFGTDLVVLPDLNGNGSPELVISTPLPHQSNGTVTSSMEARDSFTGEEIWRFVGASILGVGIRITSIDDVDGDGVPDLASPWQEGQSPELVVVSGRTGTLLHQWPLVELSSIATSVGVLLAHDVTADGVRELIVIGNPIGTSFSLTALRLDPTNGQYVSFSLVLSFPFLQLPRGGAVIDDTDGDGIPDLALGMTPPGSAPVFFGGRVSFFSGATLSPLGDVVGTTVNGHLGNSIHVGLDLNGDGVRELFVGAPGAVGPPTATSNSPQGEVVILDGATRQTLVSLGGPVGIDCFGTSIATRVSPAGQRLMLVTGRELQAPVSGEIRVGFEYGLDSLTGPPVTYVIPAARATENTPIAHAIGDVNEDGATDYAIAAPGSTLAQGSVGVFRSRGAAAYGDNNGANALTFTAQITGGLITTLLANGPAFAPGLFLVGLERAQVPVLGGTLFVGLAGSVTSPLTLSAIGTLNTSILPTQVSPALVGVSFRVQAAVVDPMQVHGISLSNGLVITF